MPSLVASLEFLADSPIYESEKPFMVLSSAELSQDPVTNIQLEDRDVEITDMRGGHFGLDEHGFQILQHKSEHLHITDLAGVQAYKSECEELLATVFPHAEKIYTYDCVVICEVYGLG
jgi:hypothetical protein